MKDYEQRAMRTLSPNYFPQHVDDAYTKDVLSSIAVACDTLDKIKKVMFYGKANLDHSVMFPLTDVSKSVTPDLVHAIIGIATEAGELVLALLKAMEEGHKIDLVNCGEEGGDIMWYMALLSKATGVTIDKMCEVNLKKLSDRYPEKFDDFLAEHRDLNKERKTLEKGLT